MGRVQTGLERLLAGEVPGAYGRRLGVIANPTAVDAELNHIVDRLHADRRVDLRALFGPEHGIRGDAQDMIGVGGETDPRTGLPVWSLYGSDAASLAPTPAALAEVDAVLFDIQDVGARYYTFVWTMVLAMRACARARVGFIVLDRPNPIGGLEVEGGDIAPGYDSFVGLCSVPNRHGLTAGEIARMVIDRERLDLELEEVAMRGWDRAMYHDDTGLPWVLPSPNMPTCDTALVYPGMCLVEGTELSEGRGTTRPFEIAGAPFVDGYRLAEALAADGLPGVRARPLQFLPTFHKHAGRPCGGVQLHVADRRAFRPYLTGMAFVAACRRLWPDEFAWRTRAYEFRDDVPAFDLLAGSAAAREAIDAGAPLSAIASAWQDAEQRFRDARDPWLLYR